MFIEPVSLREVPDRAWRLISRTPAHDGGAGVRVTVFVGPLRNVAFEVHHAEWTGALWKITKVCERTRSRPGIGGRKSDRSPIVTPRIETMVGGLSSVLPFPLMRQALAAPDGVGASIFNGDPGYRLVIPPFRVAAIVPIAKEIVVVGRMIMRGFEKLLELRI